MEFFYQPPCQLRQLHLRGAAAVADEQASGHTQYHPAERSYRQRRRRISTGVSASDSGYDECRLTQRSAPSHAQTSTSSHSTRNNLVFSALASPDTSVTPHQHLGPTMAAAWAHLRAPRWDPHTCSCGRRASASQQAAAPGRAGNDEAAPAAANAQSCTCGSKGSLPLASISARVANLVRFHQGDRPLSRRTRCPSVLGSQAGHIKVQTLLPHL